MVTLLLRIVLLVQCMYVYYIYWKISVPNNQHVVVLRLFFFYLE